MKKNVLVTALFIVIMCFLPIAFVGMYFIARAETAGVDVTLTNAGSETLGAVIVEVTGRSYKLGDLPAGSSKTVKVNATSDSHIELQFSNGRRLPIDCYFEPQYAGSIAAKVTSQAVVAVDDRIIPQAY